LWSARLRWGRDSRDIESRRRISADDRFIPRNAWRSCWKTRDAPVLVTQSSLAAELPEHQMKVVYFDKDREELEREPETNPKNLTTPTTSLYVIYTSGSTGKPKGTRVTHYNVRAANAGYGTVVRIQREGCLDVLSLARFRFQRMGAVGSPALWRPIVIVPYLASRSPENL